MFYKDRNFNQHVCTIDFDHSSETFDFKNGDKCNGDEIGAVRLLNADAGTKVIIQTEASKPGPYYLIEVKQDIDGVVGINNFHKDHRGDDFVEGTVHGLRRGYLNSKIFDGEVALVKYTTVSDSPQVNSKEVTKSVMFYKDRNFNQHVCTIDFDQCDRMIVFENGDTCNGDEIGAVRLLNADAGTKIIIQTEASKPGPNYLIEVKQDIDGVVGINNFHKDHRGDELMEGTIRGLRRGYLNSKIFDGEVALVTYTTAECS